MLWSETQAARLDAVDSATALEVVVHGADLCRAAAVPWHAPDSAHWDSMALLTEVTTQKDSGVDLPMALTERPPASPPQPILR